MAFYAKEWFTKTILQLLGFAFGAVTNELIVRVELLTPAVVAFDTSRSSKSFWYPWGLILALVVTYQPHSGLAYQKMFLLFTITTKARINPHGYQKLLEDRLVSKATTAGVKSSTLTINSFVTAPKANPSSWKIVFVYHSLA
ncbi:unnamed protein product [Linum trigynum]|uniref:Uncharacterized protein n=1 Tax=Linum trigynum TaxID=586398 RepID=A0AAV2F5S0_9ROSI